MTVSDIVSLGEVPPAIRASLEAWAGCIAGTLDREVYLEIIRKTGFRQVAVVKEVVYDILRGADCGFASVTVRAVK